MMDVYSIVEAYMRKALTAVTGMKILLVDEETSGIISLVMSQSKLFEFDVFLVDYLCNESLEAEREKHKNLNCLVLVRPTAKNIEAMADELKDPKYDSYHLCKFLSWLRYK
jgi:vacuolar protein sorting-associated protein 45